MRFPIPGTKHRIDAWPIAETLHPGAGDFGQELRFLPMLARLGFFG